MKTKYIIIGLIIVLVVLFFIQQKEHVESTENPANPVDPANPENPEDPANPANPADPANPANPADPANTLNTSDLSSEAIQNIAKVYANSTNIATFNNIRATGKIISDLSGNVTSDNGIFKTIYSTDTTTLNNVTINGTLTGKTKANTLIVDKLCFTDGSCIVPNDIGIDIYKKDTNNVKRGVKIGSNSLGNDAYINYIGFNNGEHKWMGLGWPYTDDKLVLNINPYD